jgi:spore maturation protein CgeB
MKILCVFGKHQYGDTSRGLAIEYAAFIPALRRLGHDVIHFDSWDRGLYNDFWELNKALLDLAVRECPHVMLAVQLNYEIWLETLQLIKERTETATVCWTTDDSWKYREVSRFVGKAYHAMTTTYAETLPMYRRDGIHHVLLTQWAANAEHLRPPLPFKKCDYSVTFVGAAHGNRRRRVARLRALGVPVSCFGYGWPSGPVDAKKIPEIMHRSVISLNFSNARVGYQIKARTFEIPGAGGFLLTEYAPGLEAWYRVGHEIAVFDDTEDLAAKIRYYLSRPEERDAVARAGFGRTLREHTYDIRLKEVIDFALAAKSSMLEKERRAYGISLEQVRQRHRLHIGLIFLQKTLVIPATLLWGKRRGPRAARRLVFELSWRIVGKKTFTASGWPGRMFPEQ